MLAQSLYGWPLLFCRIPLVTRCNAKDLQAEAVIFYALLNYIRYQNDVLVFLPLSARTGVG